MAMFAPWAKAPPALIPFSITYTYSQNFTVPFGCAFVNLVGMGSTAQNDWGLPLCFGVVRPQAGARTRFSDLQTTPYDGRSIADINAWIGSYIASYGSIWPPAIRSFAPGLPFGSHTPKAFSIELLFDAVSPAPTDQPYGYYVTSDIGMLPTVSTPINQTNYPTWFWREANMFGPIGAPFVVSHHRVDLAQSLMHMTNTIPNGAGPITWGGLALNPPSGWDYVSYAVTGTGEIYYYAYPGEMVTNPGMQYPGPTVAGEIQFAGASGEASTGFGHSFPGGVYTPASRVPPDLYGTISSPVVTSFSNVSVTAPGSTYPMVIPAGGYITVSGWRFP